MYHNIKPNSSCNIHSILMSSDHMYAMPHMREYHAFAFVLFPFSQWPNKKLYIYFAMKIIDICIYLFFTQRWEYSVFVGVVLLASRFVQCQKMHYATWIHYYGHCIASHQRYHIYATSAGELALNIWESLIHSYFCIWITCFESTASRIEYPRATKLLFRFCM